MKNKSKIYQIIFLEDKVVVGDAHEYLLKNFRTYDFIWSSPPCPTHSKFNFTRLINEERGTNGYNLSDLNYPDMSLYQEIILLNTFF